MSSSPAELPTKAQVAVEAVLVTGVYGVGKSTVVAQMADLLEARGHRYAALDLDWLAWADDGIHDSHTDQLMLLTNLASVVGPAPLYFTKGRSDHRVHPIRAVTVARIDRSPRRHAARVFDTRGGCP